MMRAPFALSVLSMAAALSLAGCVAAPQQAPAADTSAVAASATPATEESAPVDDAQVPAGPVETYLEWLATSREPNAARACALMTDDLQSEMLARFSTELGMQLPDCESMITVTAAMYAAAGTSAEVDVRIVEETASEATLFSTYIASGKCGTIHLRAAGDEWIMTEQSEECVGS